ncbi:hypothetical protein J4E82_011365 [Alternaria postmessia]|uniref:uncharacterized protein n=1 Tax=Alternaria postmessia TaxID=1187938 RepID=UPI0022242F49|nr:uncharacterized protein J4E82_011365 [Alternaria postmessia]KAI5365589.1 hypothetical protein J4E82_011365 [Alternaria postmessia]
MSNEQANVTKTNDSPLNRRLPCPGDLAAIPEVAEPVTEGFRLWQTEERNEESETSYKAGSATFIEIPVNGKPVMALLLSHQLGQWMLECVKLQRDHGELEGRSKGDIASIDKKIYDLQHISRSLKSAITMAERLSLMSGQDQRDQYHTKMSRLQDESQEIEGRILQLQKQKAVIRSKEQELKEQWINYMEAISISHDNAFIKAGILPDYKEVGRKGSLASEDKSYVETAASEDTEVKSHHTSAKEPSESSARENWAMVLFKGNSTNKDNSSSNEVVPFHETQGNEHAQLLEEAKLKDKLLLARVALQKAEKAHTNHRRCYKDEFSKFARRHATLPAAELASMFGPLWVQQGQKLTCELRDAEKAFEEAEKHVLNASLFTTSESLVDPAANLYLSDGDLEALNANHDNNHIIKWLSIKDGMVTPPSCHTITTFDDESPINDGVDAKCAISRKDRIESAIDQRLLASSHETKFDMSANTLHSESQGEEIANDILGRNSVAKDAPGEKADCNKRKVNDQCNTSSNGESDTNNMASSWSGKRKFWDKSAERKAERYREARQKLLNAMLEKLPRELRDMIYLELYQDSQDEPFEIVDNSTIHPHDNSHEFEPIVKAYETPYWMIEDEVGYEFAREAVETWYKHVSLSVDVKLLPQLLQDEDGVLYNNGAPSVPTHKFLRKLQVVIGPASTSDSYSGRPGGRAVHIQQTCQSLSALSTEASVARKKDFELHIAFRWVSVYERLSYIDAVCPVVYGLKAQGFMVTSSQSIGRRMVRICDEEICMCNGRRIGEMVWARTMEEDWFNRSQEECMKRIRDAKVEPDDSW